jgi:hypothetical protein
MNIFPKFGKLEKYFNLCQNGKGTMVCILVGEIFALFCYASQSPLHLPTEDG